MQWNRQDEDEERDQKLRSYAKKDYSEQIQFPVELIDRDGVVRRYTYEESLAVYHRRIQSAPWRYGDAALVKAEIGHCTRRIAQIKESYTTGQQQGKVQPSSNPRAALGPGFDVLMAYYHKVLQRRDLGLQEGFVPQVQLLEDVASCRTYHVGFGRSGGGHLFYVYPFGQGEGGRARDEFVRAQAALQGPADGVDVERLLLREETESAGYLLTGRSEFPPGLRDYSQLLSSGGSMVEVSFYDEESSEDGEEPASSRGGDALGHGSYEAGLVALHEGRMDDAIECFRASVEANPFHREAFLVLLALLDASGRYEEGQLYGEMAERHLSDDGLVAYRQGINKVRQCELDEAVEYFDRASTISPGLYQPLFFGAHVLLVQRGRMDEAVTRLRKAVQLAEGQPAVDGSLRAVERCIRLRKALRIASVSVASAALVLVLLGSVAAVIPLLLAGGVGLISGPFSEALARLLARRCFQEPD